MSHHPLFVFFYRSFLLLNTMLLFSLQAWAQEASIHINPLTESEKEHYQNGKKAIEQENQLGYQDHFNSLQKSELLPYLQAHFYLKNLKKRINTKELEHFLTQYPDRAFSRRLRTLYLNALYQDGQWKKITTLIPLAQNTAEECLLRSAYFQLGNKQKAFMHFEEVWLNHFSVAKSCQFIESKWLQSNIQNKESLLLTKIKNALIKNQFSAAKQIFPHLNQQNQALYSDLIQYFNNLQSLNANIVLHQDVDELYAHLISYYARKRSSIKAQEILDAWLKRGILDPNNMYPAQVQLAIYQAGRPDSIDALQRIANIPFSHQTDELRQWGFRLSAKKGDWQQARTFLEGLSPEVFNKNPTWYYWLGVTYSKLNQIDKAKSYWQKISQQTSFYGFLAADRIKQPYTSLNNILQQPKPNIATLSEHSPFLRSLKLMQVDENTWSRQEWQQALKTQPKSELISASKAAYSLGLYDLSLRAAVYASATGTLHLRYPQPFINSIRNINQAYQFPEAIILGLIRQESLFQINAASKAKAYGLMQLLIPTAEITSKSLGETKRGNLFIAENNLRYGMKYLDILATEKVSPRWMYVLAAYNAGPNRVKNWTQNDPPNTTLDESVLWIESIPYKETRNYVKSILGNAVIYSHLLQKPQRLSQYLISDTMRDR